MRALCTVLALAAALAVCGKLHAQGQRERLGERLQDLHLTDQQEAKIADIRKECRPKVQEAGKDLMTVVKEEEEKARAVLTPEQKTKLEEFKEERQERRAEGPAQRIAHLRELDLTDAEMAQFADIRKEYRPKIHEAGNKLRATVREEVEAIVAVLKG